jgi:hypothetical protein
MTKGRGRSYPFVILNDSEESICAYGGVIGDAALNTNNGKNILCQKLFIKQ